MTDKREDCGPSVHKPAQTGGENGGRPLKLTDLVGFTILLHQSRLQRPMGRRETTDVSC